MNLLLRPARMLLLSTLALASCVHNAAYPGKWEALESSPANACLTLAGKYKDAGEDSYSSPDVSLYDVLYGYDFDGNEPGKAVYTAISFSAPNKLNINIYGNGGLLHEASYDASLGQFSCNNGTVIIKTAGPIKIPLAYGRLHQTLSLSRTPRHLVVNNEQSGAGVVLVLPAITRSSAWYRFERLDGTPAL